MVIKSLFRRYERWNPVHPTYGAFWGVGIGIGCGVGWGPGFGPEVIGYVGAGCGAGVSVGVTLLGVGIGLPANYLLTAPYSAFMITRRGALEVARSRGLLGMINGAGDGWDNIGSHISSLRQNSKSAGASFILIEVQKNDGVKDHPFRGCPRVQFNDQHRFQVEKLGDDEEAEELFVAFAEFEEKCKETERARCIYKYALDHIPKGRAEELYKKFVAFEKQYGDREGIEDAIVGKRRFQYEDEVRKNPLNYDAWFDYIRLEESAGNKERVEDVYERAIANIPPAQEKRYWQRYIYMWINYVLYEELDAQDVDRTRNIYNLCLKIIPHDKFSFAKIWLMAAQFEIRQLDLDRARLILGSAIGKAPKDKIFKKYIEIELQLGNIDRCRKLYQKYLEWSPEHCYAWSKFAELERSLAETERARSIFELAIDQPALDMPELLWKAYIDFEISEGEYERTRALYERLLNRTKHLKVWISYAKFEASAMEEGGFQDSDAQESDYEQKRKCLQRARGVFERALGYFRTSAPELKEERAMLLEEWLNMESGFGELGDVDLVRVKLPKKLKKRRHIETEDGPAGYEEYIDYLFPEETQTTNLKILEAAYKWKKQKIVSDED
ncbi:unnamed protein product [Fraxinus pennsylvanica]|uniref:Pre-mRNA-splicing factor Syf1-like N-terminal HAT-repeats domain-containing protein n=1 Tax=Fraxinus pennsylvanica TaxID=56036 RepID=A0AAD2EE25_9LAMI|nr:unnamed protein product [Fraxinus pennsylvanica]